MLSERGAEEHHGIASRMTAHYPEVFKGGRLEVECVSSYWPRCLISMANFTSVLQERNADLRFHYVTGPKYLDYISMNLDTKDVIKGSNVLRKHLLDSLVSHERFFEAIFTDPAKAAKLTHNPKEFMDNVFLAGGISPNTTRVLTYSIISPMTSSRGFGSQGTTSSTTVSESQRRRENMSHPSPNRSSRTSSPRQTGP